MNDNELIHETPGSTPDFKTELAAQLAELMPEVVADGKIDVIKLRELLGEDVGSDTERFGLFWPGKKRALRAAQEPTTATLRPDKANSKDWDTTKNVFIEGDNLEVLKILQKHYHNKIKLIYIDPPYNTGKDFVYPDNYKEGLETYLEWTRQVNEEGKKVSTNSESEGRYHSNWLNMMYPRLKLARNLLADDGIILISIGDDEQANLKKLCDEVFGEVNQIGVVPRIAKRTSDKGTFFRPTKDYVLAYARRVDYLQEFGIAKDANPDNYPLEEKDGRKYKQSGASLYQPSLDARPNQRYYIEAPDGSLIIPPGTVFPEKRADAEKVKPKSNSDKVWRWSVETYLAQKDRLIFTKASSKNPLLDENGNQSKWNIYPKVYHDEDQHATLHPEDVIYDFPNSQGTKELKALGVPFAFAKPVGLLEFLIKLVNDDDAIILDFFAGSATTAHAVMALNAKDGGTRRFIQVQLPEPTPDDSEAFQLGFETISEIARSRITLAGEKLAQSMGLESHNLDVGFRCYKLVDTNFSKWRVSSGIDRTALEQHLFSLLETARDDTKPDDLLAEILLKQGYSLTEKITESNIAGLDVRIVGDNLVIAYLTESVKPTLDQVRAIVDEAPARIIMLEDAFQGDDELKTNLAQLCKSKGIELWTA
ncbi:MAG: site-specific DNA-methyltransferase [Chthonomonas sp.]|nr:site-specific DNA-methyltransferase [Chthonomonas sp.]